MPQRYTPLMRACLDGKHERVTALVRRGVDVNEATPDGADEHVFLGHAFAIPSGGRTPLMAAAAGGHTAIVRTLLDAGARVDAVSGTGDTALCKAIGSKQRLKVLALLVARGADVNQRAPQRPLYLAAANGDVAAARWLLARDAEVDARIWTGATALVAAARAGSAPMVELLLANGADPTLCDRDKRTPLHEAVTRRKPPGEPENPAPLALALLEAGARVDAKDKEGLTPLAIAARRYDDPLELVQVLLAAGARVDAKDGEGATPLARACMMNQLDVAMCLLDAGAKLRTKDKAGMTPLLHVARNGYLDLGYVLLERGITASERSRAIEVARTSKRTELARALAGERLPASKIPRTVRAQIDKANALYSKRRYAAAVAAYEQLPAAFQGRIFAVLSNAGYCLQQLGRNADALPLFEAAIALEPAKATHLLRAICYANYENGQWEPMLQAALRGTQISPNDDYLWQQLALAHKKLGRHREAIAAGESAVRINPKNAYAWMNLGDDYANVGDPRHVEAVARSLELAPELKTALDRRDIAALRDEPGFAKLVRRLRLK